MITVASSILFPPDLGAWDPPTWSALAAGVTATTAVLAATFAGLSVRHARETRDAQAQPYVSAFLEPSEVNPQFVYLVFRNFGNTVARDISISIEPPPRRTADDHSDDTQPVEYPTTLKTLVPGQEWRTLWDYAVSRNETDLPSSHIATISFRGIGKRKTKRRLTYEYDLEWNSNINRRWVHQYTTHDAAKALREIEKHMKKWREGLSGGLRVYVRDGDARDQARRQHKN